MIFGGFMSIINFNSIVALASGFLSFFSPCVLPLVPSYLVFISGISFDDYTAPDAGKHRKTVLFHSIAFVFGFSLVFVSLGLSSSFIGSFFSEYQTYIVRFGGLVLIAMGLIYLNVIKLSFLNQEKVIHLNKKPLGLAGSCLVGITFSLGWTPCVGPALSSILIIAATSESVFQGAYLLSLYSLGLAVPFVASAVVFDRLFTLLKRYGRMVKYSMRILGGLLVIIGFLLVTNYYTLVTERLGSIFRF